MTTTESFDDVSVTDLLDELRARETASSDEPAGGPGRPSDPAAADAVTADRLAAVDTATLTRELLSRQKVIYGVDDRQDVFAVTDEDLLADADGVVALFASDRVLDNGDGTSTLVTAPYGLSRGLCAEERFFDQPTGPFCSGFLVDSDVVATAGHCLTASTLADVRFVFGFRMSDATTAPSVVHNDQVFSARAILGRQLADTPGPDWALVRLDRPATDHRALPVRRAGAVAVGQDLHVIGHPVGLPTKVAGGAEVRESTEVAMFVANLDTYGGNSGSPVISSETHEVEGVLVRGETDFVSTGSCDISLVCPTSGCRGEDVTRTTVFTPLLDGMLDRITLLQLGSEGLEVAEWQGQLNQVRSAVIEVDGIFGPATDAATRAFQREHSLAADGKVGPSTRAVMATLLP
ncbi:trypsin-like peptidase domain-containing protein [Georgenia subflava]|nr:trypsin-like peptidase domain-containing protein [Georgenia subflava]